MSFRDPLPCQSSECDAYWLDGDGSEGAKRWGTEADSITQEFKCRSSCILHSVIAVTNMTTPRAKLKCRGNYGENLLKDS